MIKALMFGDSVLYGAQGSSRLDPKPQQILNANQSVFDFCYDYSMPGASFAGVLSPDSSIRASNGIPNGKSLFDLIEDLPDAKAILINLGGNDTSDSSLLSANIDIVADICRYQYRLFAFVGIIDISVKQSMYNTNYIGDPGPYIDAAVRIAKNAEVLRQVCYLKGYPYVDIRNKVAVDLLNTTGDIVHPNQAYSNAIFTHVAKAIS